MEERLQKLIAGAGLCSRRTAEAWIQEGAVTVNGATARLGDRADPARDRILVRGEPLPLETEKCYLMLNKPRGYTCSLSDPHAAHLVTELVADCGCRVYPVGRLDVDSQGLLFLTNDGAFAQALLHPSHGAEKIYRVTVTGLRPDSIRRLCRLRELDGEAIRPARVSLIGEDKAAATLLFAIHEGKKRQIRRMCARVGLSVRQLCRVSEGGIQLGDLPEGAWRPLTAEEIRPILDQRR